MAARHLMVEGVVGTHHSPHELTDFILWVVSSYVGIDMTILVGPECVEASDHLVAYAIIAQSHIVLNEFLDGRFTMDVFSCRAFTTSIPIDLAIERLDLQEGYVMRVLSRAGGGAG